MDIESFLPEYPARESTGFYQELYDREEFRELALSRQEPIPTEPGVYMKHQLIPRRYLSPFTMYDRILLMWEMGAGKTCAAVSIAEGVFAEPSYGITKAVYLAKSEELIYKFMEALSAQCTAGTYLPPERRIGRSHKSFILSRNALIRKRYTVSTFETFVVHEINNVSDDAIRQRFSNRVLIFDEIHNLRDTGKAEQKKKGKRTVKTITAVIYNGLFRLLSLVQNVKVVFLSGTPMTNDVTEIGAIFRLLTGDASIPTRGEFVSKFMETGEDGIPRIRDDKTDELKSIFRGRISYLKAPSIPTVYEGEILPGFQHFILQPDVPSQLQLEAYSRAYAQDTRSGEEGPSGIFNSSREAALMVYPDGSWGSAGFKKYVESSDTPLLPEPTLAAVQELSAKYGFILRQLLEMEARPETRRKIFIFCKYLRGSGLIAFGKILEAFGWRRANGRVRTGGKRYAIITGSGKDAKKVNQILAGFNDAENVTGSRLQIIMGTEKIAEGYDLYDCDICHILTPHWNYSETEQAIARIKRMGRHRNLEALQGSPVVVRVYQHCLVTPDNDPLSIDYKMYQLAETKDVAIAKMRRVLKEAAVDCQLTFARNYPVDGVDGSRECDYTTCEYTCDGITNPDSTDIDRSTWELYYADVEAIGGLLTTMLQARTSVTVDEALEYIRAGTPAETAAKVNRFSLLRVVYRMIEQSDPVTDMYGFRTYVGMESDRIFLTENPFHTTRETDTFYLRNVAVEAPMDTDVSVEVELIYKLVDPNESITLARRKELFRMLSKASQQRLLEDVVRSVHLRPDLENPSREMMHSILEEYLSREGNTIRSTLLYDPETMTGMRCYLIKKDRWEDCEPDIEQLMTQALTEDVVRMNAQSEGLSFYGKLSQKGKFKLVVIAQPGKRQTAGKACGSYSVEELEAFCRALGFAPMDTKGQICKQLQDGLLARELVYNE